MNASAAATTIVPISLYSTIQCKISPLPATCYIHEGKFASKLESRNIGGNIRDKLSLATTNGRRDGIRARDTWPLIAFVIPIINNAPLDATTDRRIKCINDDNRIAVNAKSKIHRRGVIECKRGRDQSSGSATGFRRP